MLSSSTNDFFPGFAPGICATSDNDQWIRVQAKTTIGTVTVTPSNCVVGNGLQLAVYSACDGIVLACDPGCMGCGDKTVSVSFTMNPLTIYYIWIDGWSGDGCGFTVKATGFSETLTVSSENPSSIQEAAEVSISPNPFFEKTTIQLTHPSPGEKTLDVFTPDGRPCKTVGFTGDKVEFARDQLPSGLFIFTISKEGAIIASGKLLAE